MEGFKAHAWKRGDAISAERLNSIEGQIELLTSKVIELESSLVELEGALATVRKARTTRSRKKTEARGA